MNRKEVSKVILAEYISEDGSIRGKLIDCTMEEFISFDESKDLTDTLIRYIEISSDDVIETLRKEYLSV